ncbi:KAP P-loop domain protein (plasmid) [Calothrix brevissima NIES-22]|nr:KAP P-loop domain protein [Calothrix brevissima NIES-22]
MTESTNTPRSGYSREEAESFIKKFLSNNNYKVLAVKGKWGVGKTYLVHNFLSDNKKDYYYYASVFGISSIEQLKGRIVANFNQFNSNFVNKFLNNTVEWISRNASKLERTPKMDLGLPGQSSIPLVGSLISAAGDLALNILFNENARNSIICIDDLERKSTLPLNELLGFIEYLVQELNCKIILIYNEDILLEDEISKKILQYYREKVIDREFLLEPTVEENLNLIFNESPDIEVIKSVFLKAGTNNIRVIRKTKWLIDELIPLIENWQPSLRNQVINNSIVINLAKIDTNFRKNFSITIDRLLYLINSSKYKNNGTSEEIIQLVQQVSYLGYTPLEIDELIIKSLETSLSSSDELEFLQKGEILNQRENKNQVIKKLHNLGKPYYNSFGNDQKVIIEGIISFLEEYHLDLSISEFEQIEKIALLVELDISNYEKSFLEYKLKTLEPHYFNDLNALKVKLHKYPDLEAYLEEQRNQYRQNLDITTALRKLLNNESQLISPWLEAEIDFLDNCTVDEYSKWLEEGHPDLYLMVKQFLKLGLLASQKLEQAIRNLAKKSKLNKIRAKFLYNIDIENTSNTNDLN